jgi:hypothetical protein
MRSREERKVQIMRPALLFLVPVMTACGDGGCVNTVLQDARSPDGRRHVVVFTRSCDATTDFSTQASVLTSTRAADGSGNVFVVDTDHGKVKAGRGGGPTVVAEWLDARTVRIRYPAGARIFKQEAVYDDTSINFAPESGVAPKSASVVADSGEEEFGDTLAKADDRSAIAFLDLLKRDAVGADGAYDVDNVRFTAVDSLLTFVSDSGLEHFDINDSVSKHVSLPQLRSQLSARSGRAFEGLAHLAAMYALPYPQYSQLRFRRSAAALVIHVAVGYELTFLKTRGRWLLTRLDYQQLEGD